MIYLYIFFYGTYSCVIYQFLYWNPYIDRLLTLSMIGWFLFCLSLIVAHCSLAAKPSSYEEKEKYISYFGKTMRKSTVYRQMNRFIAFVAVLAAYMNGYYLLGSEFLVAAFLGNVIRLTCVSYKKDLDKRVIQET